MKTIETILREERERLMKQVDMAKKRVQVAPQGSLRLKKKRGRTEYYYKKGGEICGNGRYLRKSELALAKDIVQRDYDIAFLRRAQKRIVIIEDFLKKYGETNIEELYDKTNCLRREIIQDAILSDEEYIQRWVGVEYEGKGFGDTMQEIITEKGERVRSKSEKIIADKLYSLGIPYRYEYPLVLGNNCMIYPDFTILRMPEREEVYLEHFGRMDDMEYVDSVIYKLNTYEKNGIYLGLNLFITYESGNHVLNTRTLDGFFRELFVEEV